MHPGSTMVVELQVLVNRCTKCNMQAGAFWKARGLGKDATFALMDQLKHYKDGEKPYDRPFKEGTTPREWWREVRDTASQQICMLAAILFSVVPHAAGPERIFSFMGWYKSKLRASMHVTTLARLTMIKQYHTQTMNVDG